MDGHIPVGAAHHEKMVIVDDAVAFCGGLDVTIRRWDTPDHDPGRASRVDPEGQAYAPFHDVQMVVDGDAAAALAEVARARWAAATGVEPRSEEHTSELESLMRNSYAVFCLK